jgi:hypothetical protein
VSFSGPTWTIAPTGGTGASSSPTLPTNLRATLASPDSVTLTWGPPTNAIACTLQRKSGSSVSYVTLLTLAIGTWSYADTQPGLAGAKPQYQLACGSAKSAAAVQFPNPT